MYAYIDETGNTGENLFDPHQPIFMTGALITKTNFDLLYSNKIFSLAERIGAEIIHANVIGPENVEQIALDLLRIFKSSDAWFVVSRVVKSYLATTKMVDTIFDAGENLAVPWHVYNYRALRLLLVFKMAHLLDEEVAQSFWSCLMERNKDQAYKQFVGVLSVLLTRVDRLPDQRSREIVSEAVKWAIENPEAIHMHSNTKALRYGHLPNMAAFPALLGGIELRSKAWKRPVREIRHGRQSQFGPTLKEWHLRVSNASPDSVFLPGREQQTFRQVFGSKFTISSAEESAGIQVVDVILWLSKRVYDEKPLGPACIKLIKYVFKRAIIHDLSFETTSDGLQELFEKIDSIPMTEEKMQKAHQFIDIVERKRQENMLIYAEQKLKCVSTNDKKEERKFKRHLSANISGTRPCEHPCAPQRSAA